MNTDPLSSAEQRHQASTRQLLAGLVVAMMFVLVAVVSFGEGTRADQMRSMPPKHPAIENRLRVSMSGANKDFTEAADRRDAIDRIAERVAQSREDSSSGSCVVVRLGAVPKSSDATSTPVRTNELVKLIGRSARNSDRSFCLLASTSKSLQSGLHHARELVDEGRLSAERVSFRITNDVPSDEIWLEVREIVRKDERQAETVEATL